MLSIKYLNIVCTDCHTLKELMEFSNYRRSQGNSRNFWFFSESFKQVLRFKKPQRKYFQDPEWDIINQVLIFCSKI